ncbi:MAG TPA: VWA domain-containing protein [Thermoanaerobaculia bacterium]|jgi:Ca-activated chloride channel family protein
MRKVLIVVSALLTFLPFGCKISDGPGVTSTNEAMVSEQPVPPPPAPKPELQAGGVANGMVAVAPTSAPALYDAYDAAHNTEEYGRIAENTFLRATDNPLSTFSIDVDRASYANVRRFLAAGQRPPKDAVRVEEMVNYFTYDYPAPTGGAPFSISTELAACPWNPQHELLLVGLQGQRVDTRDLPPANLVFLIDSSGSMQSADKLPLVKSALRLLVEQLRPQDRVAIVAYAGSAGLVLPSTKASNKAEILAAIDQLEAGGSTAGGEGIVLAYDVAKQNLERHGNNRVILATDGDFNIGVTSDGELESLIEQKRRDGIFLTVLGFGTGNIKDSKMELLADKGNGNYAYIDTIDEARKTLVHEIGATLLTIAKDVKIQVEFNPARVGAYRLIGYENRLLQKEDFNNDAKDAGELGAGHSVTALYEIIPPGADVPNASVDPLKYQTASARDGGNELATVKLRYKDPDGETSKLLTQTVSDTPSPVLSDNLRLAATVAELGMLLRDSEFKGHATYDSALQLAQSIRAADDEGYRRDLLSMIAQAKGM